MKLLMIHADLLEYWSTKATPVAEKEGEHHKKLEDVFVTFITVEPGDSKKVGKAADAIREVAGRVKCGLVFLYPYAHLSKNLAKPKEAVAVLNELASQLQCDRAPFGWYKKFHLHAKGHPLAEVSRDL
jgi:threonyl-tRNA synthetase